MALCMPSRQLQEGAVVLYEIVCVWQIPVAITYLLYELGTENETWLTQACTISNFDPDCARWISVRIGALVPSILSGVLHLVLFIFAFIYAKYRSEKSLRPVTVRRRRHKVPKYVHLPYDHRSPNPNSMPPKKGRDSNTSPPMYSSSESGSGYGSPPLAINRTKVGTGSPTARWLVKNGEMDRGPMNEATVPRQEKPVPYATQPDLETGGGGGFPPPPKPAFELGRSSSRSGSRRSSKSRISASYWSLPKGGNGHARRKSTLKDFSRELKQSDDGVDRLVRHEEGKEGEEEGGYEAPTVRASTRDESSESDEEKGTGITTRRFASS